MATFKLTGYYQYVMVFTQKELQKAADLLEHGQGVKGLVRKLRKAAESTDPITVKIPRKPVTIAKGGYDAYCIPCYHGQKLTGYTTLGFDVAMQRAEAYYQWLKSEEVEIAPVDTSLRGTIAGYHEYKRLVDAASAYSMRTGKRCPSELTPQLIGLEDKRVEVVTTYGETRRFIVGQSTGWSPIHLEIANHASHGGGAAEREYKSVREV